MTPFPAVAAVLAGAVQTPEANPAQLVLRAADANLIQRILAETHVARSPSRPSITSWFGALFEAILRWVTGVLSVESGLAAGIVGAAKLIAICVLLLAATLLLFSIARWVRRTRRLRGPSVPAFAWTEAPDAAPLSRDRLAWRRQLEERLSRGDVAGALEAFWWWLAVSVSPDSGIDASWTTRELLARGRRTDLFRLGSMLDVLMYGRRSPSPEDVMACLARFEERLA